VIDYAAVWDEQHRAKTWGAYPNEYVVRFVMQRWGHVEARDRWSFLDVGCGNGAVTWFLAREGFRVRGVDVSPTAIKRLGDRLVADHLKARVALQVADIARSPLQASTFDCAIDVCCLQHLEPEDLESALVGIRKAPRPRGCVLSITARNRSATSGSQFRRISSWLSGVWCYGRDNRRT